DEDAVDADRGAAGTREAVVGAALAGFRADDSAISGPAIRLLSSLVLARPLGAVQLTVEPRAGGRALRLGAGTFGEVAVEARETVTGAGARLGWQATAWQKVRLLPEPLTAPAYLEPGRGELGVTGRVMLPLGSPWALEAAVGGSAVRYGPDDWRVLDRRGLDAGLGVAWRDVARSVRLSFRGSHHAFPNPRPDGDTRRADTRLGLEVDAVLERAFVARVSGGWSWNRSSIPAYDFRSARAALVLAAPWGPGSVQAYGAMATQVYLNPGPEDRRVAPSDQDSGAMVSVRYAYPVDARRTLILHGDWSRSVTGFHDDFYHRFGAGIQLTFQGG
ncbi:MAG: hypothetical protein ACOC5I_00205, partial [Gemmatimonadota bacterium]